MFLLLHLSDLHIDADRKGQAVLFDVLVEAIRRETEASHASRVALVVTGDVFDSSTYRPADAIPRFLGLHARICATLGSQVPTIVLPGNHDRRWRGLVGPHRTTLFDALRESVDARFTYVAGCRAPFLAELIPPEFHGLPLDIVAYDSTVLPRGWVSAGGIIRQEDLLHVHAQLGKSSGRPLLVLVHHHLIPTPLTDVSFIESSGKLPRIARWLLGEALPAVVSNADREELTMTALGAGTALSTLHGMGRAVLLLHGHKHFPTARLVRGLVEGSGDVLIASAGSGGRRERLYAMRAPGGARLWPSFNVVRLDGDRVEIECLSFAPKRAARPPVRRDLAKVTRHEQRWEADVVSPDVRNPAKRVAHDEARFVLSPSREAHGDLFDYRCERHVRLFPHAKLRRYVDFARSGGLSHPAREREAYLRIELNVDGSTRYEVTGGLRRRLTARRPPSASPAFEWVGLLCRYGSATVCVALSREHLEGHTPFGSVTDLATGQERPVHVEVDSDEWRVRVEECPPRTLVRIYWPLAR